MCIGGCAIRGLHQTVRAILLKAGTVATEEMHDEREWYGGTPVRSAAADRSAATAGRDRGRCSSCRVSRHRRHGASGVSDRTAANLCPQELLEEEGKPQDITMDRGPDQD